jgi:hypothetical protein
MSIHADWFLRARFVIFSPDPRRQPPLSGRKSTYPAVQIPQAIRLGQAFSTTPEYWLNLQSIYDLKRAQAEMPAEALQIRSYAAA